MAIYAPSPLTNGFMPAWRFQVHMLQSHPRLERSPHRIYQQLHIYVHLRATDQHALVMPARHGLPLSLRIQLTPPLASAHHHPPTITV